MYLCRPDYAPTSDNEEDAYQSEESSEEEVKPTVRLSEPLKTNGYISFLKEFYFLIYAHQIINYYAF